MATPIPRPIIGPRRYLTTAPDILADPDQWAQKNIFDKIVTRLTDIQNATQTFKSTDPKLPYVGPDTLPTIDQIKAIRKVHFDIEGDWPALDAAVNAQLVNLRARFSGYTFDVTFGYKLPKGP